VDLTGDDVQDILQLLDGLPFGEMHLRTTSFSLWLRRTADGEWTQELQVTAEPAVRPAAFSSGPGGAGARGVSGIDAAGGAGGGEVSGAGGEVSGASGGEVSGAGGGEVSGAGAAGRPVPDGHRAVRTPLPGTFYRAPMPGAPPFVEPGSPVEPDTVVGIVETMKLMNSVSAGVAGTVAEILVGNAEFAERDTVLMVIREDLFIREDRG
jgi:acetyl-CoA carboxylase biotin carboxyl carrier protein